MVRSRSPELVVALGNGGQGGKRPRLDGAFRSGTLHGQVALVRGEHPPAKTSTAARCCDCPEGQRQLKSRRRGTTSIPIGAKAITASLRC